MRILISGNDCARGRAIGRHARRASSSCGLMRAPWPVETASFSGLTSCPRLSGALSQPANDSRRQGARSRRQAPEATGHPASQMSNLDLCGHDNVTNSPDFRATLPGPPTISSVHFSVYLSSGACASCIGGRGNVTPRGVRAPRWRGGRPRVGLLEGFGPP
jgi:hypothetical protein